VAQLFSLGHIPHLHKIMSIKRNPKSTWENICDFSYDIRDSETGAIFVYVGSEETTTDKLDAALSHVKTWARDSIEQGRIHYLYPVPMMS